MRPLRPLSSFEVHERLRRTKRRRAGYSLPFLLSRGVLPFPVEARNGGPLHGPFTIYHHRRRRPSKGEEGCRPTARGGKEKRTPRLSFPPVSFLIFIASEGITRRRVSGKRRGPTFLGHQLFLRHRETSFFCSFRRSSSAVSSASF